jgi:hypothetical protein
MDSLIHVFTREEANAALPEAEPLVRRLQALQRELVHTQREIEAALDKLSHGEDYPLVRVRQELDQLTAQQRELAETFESVGQRLESLGCLLKDLDQGLLDFYSHRHGELVFLCWRLGEDRIRFWHGLQDGFAGRQPL